MKSITIAILMCLLAVDPPPSVTIAAPHPRGAVPTAAGSTPADPRETLATALQKFDQAVALKNDRGAPAKALFRAALEGFESVAHSGIRNGHLYYDIANTHMRLGETGRAIVNYRRAARLLPDDADVQRNLAFARSLCELRVETKPTTAFLQTVLFWHYDTSPHARAVTAITAYAAFWLILVAMLFIRRRVPGVTGLAVVLALIAAASGISVFVESREAGARRDAVTIADEVILRKGNGDAYEPQLDRPLPEGVELRILEAREAVNGEVWYHVELADGHDGWARGDRIERV